MAPVVQTLRVSNTDARVWQLQQKMTLSWQQVPVPVPVPAVQVPVQVPVLGMQVQVQVPVPENCT